MKFNLFHHGGGNAPTQKEVPTSPSQDEESKLAPGATTVVNKKNKTADSDEIIAKVDAAYKEFTAFQTNLKTLLRLYKDEHHAMITIHEKRFETAKTLDLMFAFSPLSSAVAQGSPSAPAPREFFRDSLLNIVGQDEEKLNRGEVSHRDSSGGNNPFEEGKGQEPEEDVAYEPDARVSRGSVDAPEVEEEQSISLQTVDHAPAEPQVDPPADVVIPDNYPKDDGPCESIGGSITRDSSGLNVIADTEEGEDDAPTDEDTANNVNSKSIVPDAVEEGTESEVVHDPQGEKEEPPPSESYCESNGPDSEINAEPTGETAVRTESTSFTKSKGAESNCNDDAVDEEVVEKRETDEVTDKEQHGEPEITVEIQKEEPSAPAQSTDVPNVSPEKEYFSSVSPHAVWSGTTRQSYYDVQELAYKEGKKYIEQHDNLVKYVEDWERILFQRVHGLYTEYMKQRKNLQHYIKKMDQLKKEMSKLEKQAVEKEKEVNPKKVEKLDRNEVKLVGAREAHDNSGETLYLFLDEVTHRAWRDVYPLLQRTVKFDQDFSAMQAKIFVRLNGTIELLDLVGKNEAISVASRLKSLQTLHPEVIYTGEAVKNV